MSVTPALRQMSPRQDHVGLSPQAPQVGKRGQNRVDQLARQRPVAVGQAAAEHFGQSANRLALAVAAAFRIEPTAVDSLRKLWNPRPMPRACSRKLR